MARHIHIHVSTKDAGNWEENKHPRADNGQFGKGSGGGAKPSGPTPAQIAKHSGKKVQPTKPGWALRADPELAAKFEAAEKRSKERKLERETGSSGSTLGPQGQAGLKKVQQEQMAAAARKSLGIPEKKKPEFGSVSPTRPGAKAADPATTKTDWSKSNGDWTTAKKEGAEMFERAMSSAKTGGDRTDAALKLKAEAAEKQKNGSYLGAVVLGLVNDYFDRLK